MKKIWILGCALSLFSQAPYAGTMGQTSTITESWSGFYVGGNLGGIWSRFQGPVTISPFIVDEVQFPAHSQPYHADRDSFMGGGQLGYNWQMNSIVLGTEINVEGMNLNGSHVLTSSEILSPGEAFDSGDSFANSQTSWQAQWIGRLGVGCQAWLVYSLGGVSFTQAKLATNIVAFQGDVFYPASLGASHSALVGGTVGAGLEYALSNQLRIGVEYRYTDYGRHDYYTGINAMGNSASGSIIYSPMIASMDLSTNQVLARASYHF